MVGLIIVIAVILGYFFIVAFLFDKLFGYRILPDGFKLFKSNFLNRKYIKKIKSSNKENISKYKSYFKNNKELKLYRFKIKIYSMLIILFLILLMLTSKFDVEIYAFFAKFGLYDSNVFAGIFFIIAILVFVFKIHLYCKNYKTYFYNEAVPTLLNELFPESYYSAKDGISREEYIKLLFEETKLFSSNNLLKINDTNQLVFSNVYTKSLFTLGRIDFYVPIFSGCVTLIYTNLLENFKLYITNNKLLHNCDKSYLELDNQIFEKKYDVFTNNDLIAMRLLTPDFTHQLLKMHDEFNLNLEVKFIEGVLALRLDFDFAMQHNFLFPSQEAENFVIFVDLINNCNKISNLLLEEIKNVNE